MNKWLCKFCGHFEGYWLSFCCSCKLDRHTGRKTVLWNTPPCEHLK
jgi:hypothetical protein